MWQWMCFEQYQLEPAIGTVRFWLTSLKKTPADLGERYRSASSAAQMRSPCSSASSPADAGWSATG